MNYQQCVQELLALGEFKSMDYSLGRLQKALKTLEHPAKDFSSIHIVGTNGKGSTAVMLNEMLQSTYKTGLFMSPHLVDMRERIRVDGAMISEDDFCKQYLLVKQTGIDLSFFETLVAMAFLYFKEQAVEYAVLEAGLGGRLDATKLANGTVVGVTHIHLDHTRILGESREEILAEKLGIAAEDADVFITQQNNDLHEAVEQLREDAVWTGTAQTPLRGEYQKYNAGLAVAIAKHLECSEQEIENALGRVEHPGRLQYVGDDLLLDCAHNPDALSELGTYLREHHGDVTVLFGTTHNKTTGLGLLPVKDAVLTQPRIRTATPIDKLEGQYERIKDPIEAFKVARAKAHGLLVVTGSLYLVGNILEALQRGKIQ